MSTRSRGSGPNRRSKKVNEKRAHKYKGPDKVSTEAMCARCDQELWRHRRCTVCNMFVWCTGQANDEPFRHLKCPVEVMR